MCQYLKEFELFLKKKKNASNNTITSYTRDLEKLSEFLHKNGVEVIIKAKNVDISEYIMFLQTKGKSCATITRTISSIRAFFSFLAINGVISDNPTVGIKVERQKKALPRILSNKEVDLFLSQPKCDSLKGYRDKAMLELLYATGIRVSELISLNMNDVNTELGFVRCGQMNNERVIPLYSAATDAIKNYLTLSRPFLLTNGEENSLFVNVHGNRMTRQGFWKIIKFYKESAKITTDITPHILRHSFAAHLLENGADIKMIKEVMGHSDVSSTLLYAQLIKNNLKTSYIKFHPRAH